jgi:hypothetical protein
MRVLFTKSERKHRDDDMINKIKEAMSKDEMPPACIHNNEAGCGIPNSLTTSAIF